MDLFTALIALHVIAGTIGLAAFWVPIGAKKGAGAHRRWGRIASYGFIAAGALAVAMALLSLYGPEERLPSITDRALFDGLFGWMMLYLGLLTIGFADYGLASVRHARNRAALRAPRYQVVMALVGVSGALCGIVGWQLGQPLMVLVAIVGIAAMAMQEVFIFRERLFGLKPPPPRAYIGEHFRALVGMGISAYTAFLSVGLIRIVPEEVFNPLIWAMPSLIGVALIIGFTISGARSAKAAPRAKPIDESTIQRQ